VTTQLESAGGNAGRHRNRTAGQIGDADGVDVKASPLAATTAPEFMEVLRQYKAWSGDPSWRTMARRANQIVVHSTMHAAMHGDRLPKLDVVRAIIIGCGGGEEDLRSFATAWRRLATARTAACRPRPAPRTALARARRPRVRPVSGMQ